MPIDIKTKYITHDDFKVYTGIDLMIEFKDYANPSNTVQAFFKRLEDRVATFIDANFYRQIDKEYPEFSDYQKEHYAKALIEQALYWFKNGDISVDSGYDFEKGLIASNSVITKKTIAPNAKEHLMVCGLWCRHLRNIRRSGLIW